MDTKTFNQYYEINRKARGAKATAKNTHVEPAIILTADGAAYEANQTYYFFDPQTQEVRQSLGLRRDGEHLCTFGLKVVAVSSLRSTRDDALADGQSFFQSEMNRLQKRIADYELEKSGDKRSLKSFPTAKR